MSNLSYNAKHDLREFNPLFVTDTIATPTVNLIDKATKAAVIVGTALATFTPIVNTTPIIDPFTTNNHVIIHDKKLTLGTGNNLNSYHNLKQLFISGIKNETCSYNVLTGNKYSENIIVGGENMSNLMNKNLNKIRDFGKLESNWNGYGAEPFTKELLEITENFIQKITLQPKVFPTGRQSIQFEYEDKSGKYLELEIFEKYTEVFVINDDGSEDEFDIDCNIDEINKVVEKYFG